MDSDWSEYHPPKFLNSEDLHVMLLCHNFNIRTFCISFCLYCRIRVVVSSQTACKQDQGGTVPVPP